MYFELFKTRIFVLSLVGVLALWALTSSIYLLVHENKVVVISIENNRAKILSPDALEREETAAFIKSFLENLYNYNAETFSRNVGLAVEVISPELWEKEKDKFLALKNRLKEDNVSQSAIIEKINLLDDGRYEAILNMLLNVRVSKEAFTHKVVLSLKKIKRSESNPWGLEVEEFNETRM